jgi:hypothetical protein
MWVALAGALINFIPDMFSGVTDYFKRKQEAKLEAESIKFNMELERIKGENALKLNQSQGDIEYRLQELENSILGTLQEFGDRQDARRAEVAIHANLVRLVAVGKDLKAWPWVQSFVYLMAGFVEAFSAAVRPGITLTVFMMWAAWKGATVYLLVKAGGLTVATVKECFTVDDWVLLELIAGFWFGGRAKEKWQSRNAPQRA